MKDRFTESITKLRESNRRLIEALIAMRKSLRSHT